MTPFELIRPDVAQTGVVFASPHSGRDYPSDLMGRTVLKGTAIRSSEDAFVDLLVAGAPDMGAPLLKATAPRAYIDLNRNHDELDPSVVAGARRQGHNPRISSGLGVIPRVVANGQAIYRGKIPLQEARERIDGFWHPYHRTLEALLREQHAQFGMALLIDCHSMPHEAIEDYSRANPRKIDVVLGDRFGASASGDTVDRIEAAFVAEGLQVSRNTPFAGAFITQHYGRPGQGQQAVQIELDRSLYMDERRIEPLPCFGEVQQMMTRVMSKIVEIGQPQLKLAAE